jgi:hypothetical protein
MPLLVDAAKQLLPALFSGALPSMATKLQLLPFMNPLIVEELWLITSALALLSSVLTYNLAQRFQKPRAARWFAGIGLVIAVVALGILQAVVGHLLFSENPELQDFFARLLFILLFVGLGLVAGYGFAYFL